MSKVVFSCLVKKIFVVFVLVLCSKYYFTVEAASTLVSPSFIETVRFIDHHIPSEHQNSSLLRQRRQAATGCGKGKKPCTNRKCIDSDLFCDGAVDCTDRSDETVARCSKMKCAYYSFRCAYGACVDMDAKCNNVTDCADNSDEQHIDCKPKTTTGTCKRGQFMCNNGRCIPSDQKCDGTLDCTDGSDETLTACYGMQCASYLVQCDYGACIDGGTLCNNVKDCPDGSDELASKCSNVPGWIPQPTATTSTTTTTTPSPTPSSGAGCTLPNFPYFGSYTIIGPRQELTPGRVVPETTALRYSCKEGHVLSSEDSISECRGSQWSLEITECLRPCSVGISHSVDFVCRDKFKQKFNCTSKVPSGTEITSVCKNNHFRPLGFVSTRVCTDGAFNNPAPRCLPDCGIDKSEAVQLIINGAQAKRGAYPWHVAIYQKMQNFETKEIFHEQICGGTIIATHVVVSAAHCFWDRRTSKPFGPQYYSVSTGKINRAYDNAEDDSYHYVQKVEVKAIYFHEQYDGEVKSEATDFVLMELERPLSFSDFVHAACYNFDDDFTSAKLSPDSEGKVAGWGRTGENEAASVTLKELKMPVINYNTCKKELDKYDFTRYLSADKFCAGYTNGSALCSGDSGGGFVFSDQASNVIRWYLMGVVSAGPRNDDKTSCRSDSYTTFTKLSAYKEWILDQLTKLGI